MRKPVLAVLVASLAMLPLGAAIAAAPEHDVGVDGPFPDNVCGVPGTTVVRFNNIARDLGNDQEQFLGSFAATFTADDSGRSITIHGSGRTRSQTIVDEEAGTITFIETVSGAPEVVKGTHGRVLTHDVGRVLNRVRVYTIDPETGDPDEQLSDTWEVVNGPHPDLESGFDHFCEVVEPYLLG